MKNAEAQTTIYRKDYQAPAFLIDQVELEFDIGQANTEVRATLQMRRAAGADGQALRLDGADLSLLALAINGRELGQHEYQLGEESLTIAEVADAFELTTAVKIHPKANTALEGLYQSGDFLLTQCEAEGFRKITYFPDRPDVMTTFRVRLNADRSRYPVLLSNGNQVDAGELDDGRHFAVWDDPFPKPSYLFALVAGDLEYVEDRFQTSDDRDVTLRIYVEQENLDKVDHAMRSLKHSMAWDESRFELAYDLDIYNIVATNDFNMGAMENKSLNIFNSKYVLAKPETATDADFQAIEGVIGHEYFHNWTGNRVTCRDWFQLSLKEGLTVFRDQEFSADMQSRAVKRIEDVRMLRSSQFAEDAGPMAHPVRPDSFVEINNFYTRTVYEKGAEVVRMYHTLLGAEGFQKGMRLYFRRHDGQAVTCDDFRAAMADANKADLDQFERWYLQAGTPVVTVDSHYDATAKRFTLSFKQGTPATPGQGEKLPQHLPVRVGLIGADGKDLPLTLAEGELIGDNDVLELRQAEQSFVFTEIAQQPVPSLFRGFSAPIKLRYDYSRVQLAFLMANDADSFNRWDASQQLAIDVMLAMVADQQLEVPPVLLDAVRMSLSSVVGNEATDPALIAAALTLPDENYMAGVMVDTGLVADVEGIHRAREQLRETIAHHHAEALRQVYASLHHGGDYDLAPSAMAARSLRNTCLSYLTVGGSFTEAQQQFARANNMTDSIAALRALVHAGAPDNESALDEFLQRWQHDPLVMDKWLIVQATDPTAGALDRITQLLDHSVFDIGNPNKVRSLIGAFGVANPLVFHAADGSGYAWLAERVLEIDALNPQVASRLVRAFDPWQRYDQARQQLIRDQLDRLAKSDLSKDVDEIVNKALAA